MDVNHFYGENNTAIPWFNQSQWVTVPEWFHGVTSRKDGEALLMCKPPGHFLIRVGESRNGFTLSYRATDRCRHFMIDTLQDGNYSITGESTRHRSLQDLVDFHSRTPIMPFNEVLTVPCIKISEDGEDTPPALPHRTSLPAIPTLLTPPHYTDLPPNGSNSHLPDQGSHFDLRLQPPVNAVEPTALPHHAYIYSNVPAKPASDLLAEVPSHREADNNVRLYPTLPYPPFTSRMPLTEQGAPHDKRAEPNPNPNPKLLAVPSQIKAMALFRKRKGSQGSLQSAEADPSGAPRLVDDGLPEEYMQPPPYAPGYY